jgi:hypothetical protein
MQCRVPADRVVRSHYRYVPRLAAPSEGPLPAVSAMLTYVPTADAGDAAYRRHETNVETVTVTQNLTRPAHTHAHAAPKPMAVVAAQLRLDARILMLTHTKHAESALLAAARLADRAERDEGLYRVGAAITHACCAAAAESESVLRQMVALQGSHSPCTLSALPPTAFVHSSHLLWRVHDVRELQVELSVVDMLVPRAYTVPPHSPSHGEACKLDSHPWRVHCGLFSRWRVHGACAAGRCCTWGRARRARRSWQRWVPRRAPTTTRLKTFSDA